MKRLELDKLKLEKENSQMKSEMRMSQANELFEKIEEHRKKEAEMEDLIRQLKRENQILKVKAGK